MGNNLEKALLVEMLYDSEIGKQEQKPKIRNKLIGRVNKGRANG